MKNLDVICKTLSIITHRPERKFRRTIMTAIKSGVLPPSKLLDDCPDGEERVNHYVEHEAAGILNWAIEAGVLANKQRGRP